MGTFSKNFVLGLRGVDLGELPCAPVPAKNLAATLIKNDDETLTLTITIEKTTKDTGTQLAEWAAQVFFESIINQFPFDIQEGAAPRGGSSRVIPETEESDTAVLVGEQISVQCGSMAAPLRPSQSQLDAIKKRFDPVSLLNRLRQPLL